MATAPDVHLHCALPDIHPPTWTSAVVTHSLDGSLSRGPRFLPVEAPRAVLLSTPFCTLQELWYDFLSQL